MAQDRPLNPLLSRFPMPMTLDEARREGRRARRSKLRLPDGHPYAAAPTWLPLSVALGLERVRTTLLRRRRVCAFRLKR